MQTESSMVVRFSRAAELLGTTRRAIHGYTKRGLLDRVVLPGGRRALGVSRASLEKLIRRSTQKGGAQ